MATPIEAIAGRLLATSALTALVGSRSYPSKPTDNAALPYVVFYKQSGGDGINLAAVKGTRNYDIRVDVYSTTEEEAEEILEAVAGRLDGWQDRPNGVQGCFARGDADEQTQDDGSQVSGQTYSLWFNPQ